jgi:hypothetical protein
MSGPSITRAVFLRNAGGVFAVAFLPRLRLADFNPLPHPDPRPGITAEHVLADAELGAKADKKVLQAYAVARAYPETFDGIACGCGCGGKDGMHRSLLVCFESKQPTGCRSCQLEAELVGKMAKEDKTLADIRAAVDKEFG